jgi:uncharacterized protein (DUF2147 family)
MNLLLVMMLMFSAGPAPAGVAGNWVTADKSVVQMYPCGQLLCGKLMHIEGKHTVDDQNPSADLRKRPLCGLNIVEGFKSADGTHFDGGHVYDPESGKTYRGVITLQGDVLKLRGYVGVPLFGRTEVWRRAQGNVVGCK